MTKKTHPEAIVAPARVLENLLLLRTELAVELMLSLLDRFLFVDAETANDPSMVSG